MQAPVEVRYAGVMISRAQEVQALDGDDSSFFISTREPMPVGTVLRLRSGDRETPARVVHAVEAVGGAASGMQIRFIGESEEVAPEFIPPAPVAEAPPAATEEVHRNISGETLLGAGMTASSSSIDVSEDIAGNESQPSTAMAEPAVDVEPVISAAVDTCTSNEDSHDSREVESVAQLEQAVSVHVAPEPSTDAVGPAQPALPTQVLSVPNAEPSPLPSGDVAVAAASGEVEILAASGEVEVAAASGEVGVAEAVPVAVGTSMSDALENAAAAAAEPSTPVGDLPPARPLAGPSGRRKTKRRK